MSSPQKKWTLDRKMAVVLELLRGGDAAAIGRSKGIRQAQLFEWGDRFLEAGKAALKVHRNSDYDKRIRQLERLIGRLTVEKEILKKPNNSNTRGNQGVKKGDVIWPAGMAPWL